MAKEDISFEGNDIDNQNNNDDVKNNNNNNNNDNNNNNNDDDTTHLDGGGDDDITNKSNNTDNNNDNNNNDTIPHDVEVGTEIEFEGATYTVAENGDIVDKDGNVFKEAKDVKAWLEENNTGDEEINIDSIREAIGEDIVDENGNNVEFENTPDGVKSYVESVIAMKLNEASQAGVNKLFADNPLVKQFIDYVTLTGSPKGFGDIPDRTGIELDKDNETQLKAVIKMAAEQFGNKSLNDNYIEYLKSTGALYDEAKTQLAALKEYDTNVRKQIEEQAENARRKEQQDVENYWKGVNDAINKKVIGGYKLPDTFVKEINGQKRTYTLNDFYNYLSKATEVDSEGNALTGYQADLAKMSDEETLNQELLSAWLMFRGGTYKDLVDMAVKEEQVRVLRLKSKERSNKKKVKIVKPQGKTDSNDIILS